MVKRYVQKNPMLLLPLLIAVQCLAMYTGGDAGLEYSHLISGIVYPSIFCKNKSVTQTYITGLDTVFSCHSFCFASTGERKKKHLARANMIRVCMVSSPESREITQKI